jgi:hypothetical protein
LTAKSGYTFTGVAENSYTHTGATSIANAADSGVVTITFPATEEVMSDAAKLAADKGLIEAGSYEIPLASQGDQAAKTAWVQGAVEALIENGTTATVTWNAEESKYDVALELGTETGSATIVVTEAADPLAAEKAAAALINGKSAEVAVEKGEDKAAVLAAIKALDETENALIQALTEANIAIADGKATVTFAEGVTAEVTVTEAAE